MISVLIQYLFSENNSGKEHKEIKLVKLSDKKILFNN